MKRRKRCKGRKKTNKNRMEMRGEMIRGIKRERRKRKERPACTLRHSSRPVIA